MADALGWDAARIQTEVGRFEEEAAAEGIGGVKESAVAA
jgi:hypothetical protein